METTQNNDGISICSQLNLSIQDLNIQNLLNNPIYRRLYNIVLHDTNKSQYEYRKNLIKQLYFLLKITPIMKQELQQVYLDKLQKWYNTNDHKKTQLASGGLKNLFNQYVTSKQSTNCIVQHQRPQSGITWNKNINPFLRPYTAKRTINNQSRPESYKSKFGQSTKASVKLQSCQQITIRQFALSIKQQFEVSQDFLNKNRTIHPQSQPIYQQLFNIIKKAGININNMKGNSLFYNNQKDNFNNNNKSQLIQQQSENQILFQRDRQQFFNNGNQNDYKNNNIIRVSQKQQQNLIDSNPNIIINDDELFDKVSQQSQKDQQDNKQSQQQNTFQRKIYTKDQSKTNDQQSIQGFQYLKNSNQKDIIYLKKINNKYLHITNNKFINSSKDDNQLLRNYVNYTRIKSNMKKQYNRKSQTKRLLSGKIRSTTNLIVNNNNIINNINNNLKIKNQRIYSALPKKNINNNNNNISLSRLSHKTQLLNTNGAKIYDFTNNSINQQSSLLKNKQNSSAFITSMSQYNNNGYYNQRQQLNKLYNKPIQQYKKLNKNTLSYSQLKSKQKNLLTKYDCFLTRQKINPIADIHIQNHNQQALQQIQKIKQKISFLGKKCLSTDSLMKALYLNSYDDIGSCSTIGNYKQNKQNQLQKQNNNNFDWKKRNVYFNMISNGQKKMKKKTRKLHKK